MRQLLSIAGVLCLAGAAYGSSVWTESFTGADNSAPAGWTVLAGNGGTMTIQSNTLFVSSAGDGYASGYPNTASFPVLAGWDQTLPYRVEFDFKIPDLNNHWLFVYVDPQVQTVIDYSDEFIAYGGGAGNRHILDLTADQWYHVEYDVVPGWGYDVYVDGVKLVSKAPFVYESVWAPFRIGDRLDGSYDLGSAYWDNFEITTNIPEPLTMGLVVLSLVGLVRYTRRRLTGGD